MHLHGQKQYFTVQPTILIEKTQPMVEKLRPEYGKTQINFPKLRSDFSKTQPLEFFKLSQIQLHCTKNKPEYVSSAGATYYCSTSNTTSSTITQAFPLGKLT